MVPTEVANRIKQDFGEKKEKLFSEHPGKNASLRFSLEFSLLVEEFIRALAADGKYNFALASAGSFSRRELSPFSDIDLMFITDSVADNEKDIVEFITRLWDNGIEVSHTVREFSDVKKFIEADLHTFTQFFEIRFLLGNDKIYLLWNDILLDSVTEEVKVKLINEMLEDIQHRYEKYDESPKILEPNVKLSAGGLRDFQAVEWMYMLVNKTLLNKQNEMTQAENFIQQLKGDEYTSPDECNRIYESYNLIITVRNLLHIINQQKNDRLEHQDQKKIASMIYHSENAISSFMKDYYNAANVINRFSKSMAKTFRDELTNPLPDTLSIRLDDDYTYKGNIISYTGEKDFTISSVLRGFYYRGLYNARFDEKLRAKIIETVENVGQKSSYETESSVFFREILKLPRNVGRTLSAMNELGVLGVFLPEFKDMIGFLQHGVYHFYTADEHTLMTIKNVEKLEREHSQLGRLFGSLKDREYLYLGLLFHDIAKPINVSGHEIIGAEVASAVMFRLGYSEEEIEKVSLLVRYHLLMEQVAFRRNLNDPDTLNNFASKFNSTDELNLLYLVTYADLSAVNPAVWTSWKSDLLAELYRKTYAMLEEKISGEEFLITNTYVIPKEISRHSDVISEDHVQEHIESINDIAYAQNFTEKEIAKHVEEIQKGVTISTSFKELNGFTNVTVITRDFSSLLSKICGVLSINGVNIHDARIFTRKDGIVIDTFNVTDFNTGRKIEKDRYGKIRKDMKSVISGLLQLSQEFAKMKSKWWRIETRLFKRTGKVKIEFENYERYTIIDIFSPDRLGFLYQVTNKMNQLGLSIYFAKIATRGDDIVDSFYVLNTSGKKISPSDYDLIKTELTEAISQIL
jgi:[protein-PII] uridylyltransferase